MPISSLSKEVVLHIADELSPPDLCSFVRVQKSYASLLAHHLVKRYGGWDALKWCASQGNLASAKALVANGVDPTLIREKDNQLNALHVAALKGHVELVEFFIEKGVDVQSRTAPLVPGEDDSEEEWEEKKKASVSMDGIAFSKDAKITHYWFHAQAVHFAAYGGSVEVLNLLMEKGANIMVPFDSVDSQGPEERFSDELAYRTKTRTPIHVAAEFNNPKFIQVLLQYDVPVDLPEGYYKETPLGSAIMSTAADSVKILLDNGADHSIKQIIPSGNEPAHATSIRIVLNGSKGYLDKYTTLFLHGAAQHSHVVVKMLVKEFGADMEELSPFGETVLYSTIDTFLGRDKNSQCIWECIVMLLRLGADVDEAMKIAREKGEKKIATFLKRIRFLSEIEWNDEDKNKDTAEE